MVRLPQPTIATVPTMDVLELFAQTKREDGYMLCARLQGEHMTFTTATDALGNPTVGGGVVLSSLSLFGRGRCCSRET